MKRGGGVFLSGKVWIKKKVFRGPDGEAAKAARQQRRAQVPIPRATRSPAFTNSNCTTPLKLVRTRHRKARTTLQAAAKRSAAPKRTPLEGEARMTILYGTQTGHSRTFALELSEVCQRQASNRRAEREGVCVCGIAGCESGVRASVWAGGLFGASSTERTVPLVQRQPTGPLGTLSCRRRSDSDLRLRSQTCATTIPHRSTLRGAPTAMRLCWLSWPPFRTPLVLATALVFELRHRCARPCCWPIAAGARAAGGNHCIYVSRWPAE